MIDLRLSSYVLLYTIPSQPKQASITINKLFEFTYPNLCIDKFYLPWNVKDPNPKKIMAIVDGNKNAFQEEEVLHQKPIHRLGTILIGKFVHR